MEENLKQHKADIIKYVWSRKYGKTTLSIQLADYYKTEWVPEFGIICKKNGIIVTGIVM
jgi:hypothetical protein